MKWKKVLIVSSVVVGIALPVSLMLSIASNPRAEQASTTFLMDFTKQIKEQNNNPKALDNKVELEKKQKYLNSLKEQTAEVFKEYKKQNKDTQLELDFRTLKSSMTPGEINYFSELKKSLMAINENLSFNLIPRSPVSVQEGFYQKNSEMVSFYWSPDYNDIGTWLTYMFGDFQISNMWPAISAAINDESIVPNLTDNASGVNWIESLAAKLSTISIDDKGTKIVSPAQNGKYKAMTMAEINNLVNANQQSNKLLTNINTKIGNEVASWISQKESVQWGGDLVAKPVIEPNGYYTPDGGIENFKPSMQTNFMDFVTSYNQNIPNYQDGPKTKSTFLIRKGFHVPTNPNGTTNYRDYYYNPAVSSQTSYTEYLNGSPFESAVTSLNPCFTKASTATFFQTIFSTLFSWSVNHDFTSDAIDPNLQEKFDVQIVSQGSKASIDEVKTALDNGIKGQAYGDKNNPQAVVVTPDPKKPGNFTIDIPIRPIPWVNSSGRTTNTVHYLSPLDYLVGLGAYENSILTKLNSNNYFLDLIGLDIENTVKPLRDIKSKAGFDDLINKSPNDSKKLTLHFNNPQLSPSNIVDILSIQYFSALPYFSPKVQKIFDIKDSSQISGQGWNDIYGAGSTTSMWQDCWYTTPYYISKIDSQYYEMSLNESFFDCFTEEVKNDPNNHYRQFQLNPTIDGIQYKKIPTLKYYYNKSGFPELTTFENFKSNIADKSLIPASEVSNVENTPYLKQQVYSPQVVKVSKTDLIPYNLQVFNKSVAGSILLYDSNGNQYDYTNDTDAITADKYGNMIFKKGYSPSLKSNISQQYYDLIVKNFFTPIDAKDSNGKLLPAIDRSSAIIRTAINDSINWLSLSAIVNNSQNKVMQNSFLPYGTAALPSKRAGTVELGEDRLKYWHLSAYKLSAKPNDEYGHRLGGLLEWSILDYFNNWKSTLS